jgi:hypothetical protein
MVRLALVIAVIGACAFSPSALAYKFGWSVCANPSGSNCDFSVPTQGVQTVYDWSTADDNGTRCSDAEWADGPVRAIRFQNDAQAWRVQLSMASSFGNRRMIGPDLLSVKRESDPMQPAGETRPCQPARQAPDLGIPNPDPQKDIVLGSHNSSQPQAFDNQEWLNSPYLVGDGTASSTIYGILHNEYHGYYWYPDQCLTPYGDDPDPTKPDGVDICWFSSITMAKSDGSEISPRPVNALGARYVHQQPASLIASIPYQYVRNWGRQGYVGPTNVIKWRAPGETQSHYYLLSLISSGYGAQQYGTCVLRTHDLSQPTAWRAWGGSPQGWNVPLVDPYSGSFNPADHVCQPVSPWTITFLAPRALVWNRYLEKFMAVFSGLGAVRYSLSDDLTNWSQPQLLVQPETPPGECAQGAGYPTLLDPGDPAKDGFDATVEPPVTPNFDHPGRHPYLYMARANHAADCAAYTPDRDLVRVPLRLAQRRATLKNGLIDPITGYGYDTTAGTYFSAIDAPGYDGGAGDKYALATTWIGQSTNYAFGATSVRWQDTDDVWYGSAFFLPEEFASATGGVDLMRWESQQGGITYIGGLRLRAAGPANNKVQLFRGSSAPASTYLGPSAGFSLPEGRWIWIEVHQTLGNSSDDKPFNEVFVDGRLVFSSTAINRDPADTSLISTARYGFVNNGSAWGTLSSMSVDRSTVTGGQLGALGAPATPLGLRFTPSGSSITVDWNAVPEADGYRLYRQAKSGDTYGAWSAIGWDDDPSTPTPDYIGATTHTDTITCGTTYRYRVTSYKQSTNSESVVTSPVETSC